MREIGSEFWSDKHFLGNNADINKEPSNDTYVLSGRTALDFIIRDIKVTKPFFSIMLPDYCCESMLQPFLNNGIHISFYSVQPKGIQYDFTNQSDAVLLLDYFGYERMDILQIAKREKENGKVIIYDGTHKINGNMMIQSYVDYSFCSYRKWLYCNFCEVDKYYGEFLLSIPQKQHTAYMVLRNRAAEVKEKYITDKINNKEEFLQLFSEAEKVLEYDYSDYIGDFVAINKEAIKTKRIQNASYLINELRNNPYIELWSDQVEVTDAPLFVPILVNKGKRNQLHRYLIEHKIYCPIHWPKSSLHYENNLSSRLYNEEISLICDQRYGLEDMKREVMLINDFLR